MVKVKGATLVDVRGKKKHYIIIENSKEESEVLAVSEKQYKKILKVIGNEHGNTLDIKQ